MQDYGLERYLKAQDVYCSKKSLGCHWRRKLRDFEEHLFEERFKVIERQYQLQDKKLKKAVEQNKVFEERVNAREKEIAMLKEKIQPMKMVLGEFPLDFKVAFKTKSVYLPPFFTHPHGYRKCIFVDPNGFGDGEGTHVSLYAYFMQCLFDEHLKWPFKGKITIHTVNQAGDYGHIKGNFNYSDETGDQYCSRVTGREKAECAVACLGEGGGLRVLEHPPRSGSLVYNPGQRQRKRSSEYMVQ